MKMQQQKLAEQVKAWEKQQKLLKQLKTTGKSKSAAEEQAKRMRQRDLRSQDKGINEDAVLEATQQLLERPREYTVKFTFPKVGEEGWIERSARSSRRQSCRSRT